eukprot:scaffold10862_cov63-Phaeocystis_antarctica.AAC.4
MRGQHSAHSSSGHTRRTGARMGKLTPSPVAARGTGEASQQVAGLQQEQEAAEEEGGEAGGVEAQRRSQEGPAPCGGGGEEGDESDGWAQAEGLQCAHRSLHLGLPRVLVWVGRGGCRVREQEGIREERGRPTGGEGVGGGAEDVEGGGREEGEEAYEVVLVGVTDARVGEHAMVVHALDHRLTCAAVVRAWRQRPPCLLTLLPASQRLRTPQSHQLAERHRCGAGRAWRRRCGGQGLGRGAGAWSWAVRRERSRPHYLHLGPCLILLLTTAPLGRGVWAAERIELVLDDAGAGEQGSRVVECGARCQHTRDPSVEQ